MSINVNDKNLGHATAYAYYKAGGGTMTEAEFTEFMADFGTASQTAVEAAQAALASKNAAQTAATTATTKASEATTAATTATNKAAEAQADADAAALDASQAMSAASTATTKATEATTAAATATSAKTDAVAANTAAQSAKTAAQTAQTGAETAAASVQSSAEQIATNAEDISQLKSEFTDVVGVGKITASVIQWGVFFPADYVETKTLSQSTSWGITDKINVGGYDRIVYSGLTQAGNSPQSVWFDASKEPIAVFKQAVGTNTLDVPSGAEYVAFSVSTADRDNNLEIVTEKSDSLSGKVVNLTTATESILSGVAEKMAWSWWVSNRCVDSRGVLYFGFVTEDAYIGVGMRYPSGMTFTKKLAKCVNKDDHNAPAVNILSDGTILVTASNGHGVNNHRFVFLSKEPNTINCDFDNKSFDLPKATGYLVETTYAQTFIGDNDIIYTMYRVHTYNGTTHKTAWAMSESSDRGESWVNYVFMYADLYCLITDTTTSNIKNILICDNPVTADNSIRGGYVDLVAKKVYADDGTLIMDMPLVPSSGYIGGMGLPERSSYTVLVANEMVSLGLRHRLLTAFKTPYGSHTFLWAKSTDTTFTDFEYYRYDGGTNLLLGTSGRPLFIKSSYIGGADFGYSKDNIIYCKNEDNTADGVHTIHKVVINNGAVISDTVINSASMSLSRPFAYDGDKYMVMIGHYYDTSTLDDVGNSFTAWQFDAMFS